MGNWMTLIAYLLTVGILEVALCLWAVMVVLDNILKELKTDAGEKDNGQ